MSNFQSFLSSDNIELERGEITKSGFIKLNEMEAEDNEGDTEDLWITLQGMGFNKALILDEVTRAFGLFPPYTKLSYYTVQHNLEWNM